MITYGRRKYARFTEYFVTYKLGEYGKVYSEPFYLNGGDRYNVCELLTNEIAKYLAIDKEDKCDIHILNVSVLSQ